MAYALVVYESMFGNTQRVAEAIRDGLADDLHVDVLEVDAAPTSLGDDVSLLVVGGPTHMLGMSSAKSRLSAKEQATGPLVSHGVGLDEWLGALVIGSPLTQGAAFDTHTEKRWVPGAASKRIRTALRRKRVALVDRPTSFYVQGTLGPLAEGEVERARAWGHSLARRLRTSGAAAAR
jgi:Flavodoxin